MPTRLDRRTVVVTRGKGGDDPLAARLRELGAEVREVPSIAFAPPADPGPLDAALRALGGFDWAVFASATAVERTVERLAALGLPAAALRSLSLAAVGPAGHAVAQVQGGASAPGHHEADAVADVVIEAEPVGTADQPDVVTPNDVQELRLALLKAALWLRRVVAVQMRR